MILLKFLNKYDKELYDIFKKIYDTKWHTDYIFNFLKFINVNVLDINVLKDNTILLNFMKYKKPEIIGNDLNFILSLDYEINIGKEKKEIKDIIKNIPDVLILNHDSLRAKVFRLYDHYDAVLEENNDYYIHDAENYDFDKRSINDIINYRDEIHLFGHVYKLDSVLLDNYNNMDKHAILGLHCNNNRYIYNGWLTKKKDFKAPCPLFKFDWDLKTNNKFCLKTRSCNITDVKQTNLCFSFNKGDRLLVYVRDDDFKKTSEISKLSYSNLSNKNEILRDYYQFDNLTIDTIKQILNYFEINYSDAKDLDDFEDLLITKLQELYNYNDNSKKQLIDKIIKLKPAIKGLTNKNKNELKQILNKLQIEEIKLGTKRKIS